MAESIGAVHVEFTTSTAQLRSEIEKGGQAVRSFGDRVQQTARTTTGSIGASNGYTATFGKLGDQVKGAAASVSGFSQVMVAMGEKVSPAVKGMGSALSALLAGGVSPLGIAIGGLTAIISSYAGRQAEAAKRTEETTKKLEDQRKAFDDLVTAAEKAALKRRAGEAGTDVDVQRIREQIEDAQERAGRGRDRLAGLPAYAQTHGAMQEDIRRQIAAAESEIARLSNDLTLIERRISAETPTRESVTRDRDYQRQRNEEVMRLLHPERFEAPMNEGFTPREFNTDADELQYSLRADDAALRRVRAEQARERGQRDAESYAEGFFAQQEREWEERWDDVGGVEGAAPKAGLGRTDIKAVEESLSGGLQRGIAEVRESLLTIGEMGADVSRGIAGGFSDAFTDVVMGAKSASEAFKAFAASVLSDMVRMFSQQMALRMVTSVFGVPGAAAGGSFMVRGTGGTDSQLVSLRASPGERVDVSTPGQQAKMGGGAGVTVNVFNSAPGVQAEATTREGPHGTEIDVLVSRIVAGDLERGGAISRTLERTHGTARRGRRG